MMKNTGAEQMDCWILDEVETDFVTVWELISVFQQRQASIAESEILIQIEERLEHLARYKLLSFYEGIIFNGDEIPINVLISREFIIKQSQDWKNENIQDKQIKIHITPYGRELFLKNCGPNQFIF